MPSESGKISVIMGIRNCAYTLPEAIDSIIAQTYTNWELIMCDDASTDTTYEVAQAYVNKYPEKMILIQNDTNRYLAYSLNRCLEYATGEYVARMDGDDISMPERFQKEIDYLVAHPEFVVVGCAMRQFDGDELLNVESKPEFPTKDMLRHVIPFNHATIMTYKWVYDQLGGYTVADRTKRAQDYDLWFRFYAQGLTGANLQEELYLVREDLNAAKRRTFSVRWNAYKTTCYGYKLMGYPKRWLAGPFFGTIAKSLVPASALRAYRDYQKRNTS